MMNKTQFNDEQDAVKRNNHCQAFNLSVISHYQGILLKLLRVSEMIISFYCVLFINKLWKNAIYSTLLDVNYHLNNIHYSWHA